MNHLIEAGTLERWLVNLLEDYVLRRANIVISGGTGNGKTTLLNVLAKFIPKDQRILVIDDSSEIRIAHENLVRLGEAASPERVAGGGHPRAAKSGTLASS